MEERAKIVETLIEKTGSIMKVSGLTEESVFADLDMKSVNYSALINILEDEFDVEINYMEFKRKATIAEAADYVAALIDG
ncbi:MAG: phosphopantetheine-binding protein [Lachnospiraceae bacterium]|jgi:acyl carrier protein|nr:phosphopantetheine-binding protein [Lachnospiraceae bacterium]